MRSLVLLFILVFTIPIPGRESCRRAVSGLAQWLALPIVIYSSPSVPPIPHNPVNLAPLPDELRPGDRP